MTITIPVLQYYIILRNVHIQYMVPAIYSIMGFFGLRSDALSYAPLRAGGVDTRDLPTPPPPLTRPSVGPYRHRNSHVQYLYTYYHMYNNIIIIVTIRVWWASDLEWMSCILNPCVLENRNEFVCRLTISVWSFSGRVLNTC